MSGFVYFIRCRDRIKIGFSKNPAKRLTKINADAPYPCELLGSADADVHSEKSIHEQFAVSRVHSEWFLVTDGLLGFIREVSVWDPILVGDKFSRADLSKFTGIKAWRYRNRMTLVDAAKKIGVTAGFLSRVESGAYRFAAERVRSVSAVTGLPPHVLRPDVFGAPISEQAQSRGQETAL